jgi:FkbM family methyltransferase
MPQGEFLPFQLDLNDELSAWRAKTFYSKEPETLKWLEYFAVNNLNCKTLIDVGANIGIYVLYWLHFSDTRAIAIEPFAKNVDLLIKNTELNNFVTRVEIIRNPLSSQNKLGWALIQDDRPGGSDYKISFTNKLNQTNSSKIETLTLDSILNKKQENFILKIDTDGFDFDILKGAEVTLGSGKIISVLIESSEEDQNLIEDYLKRFDFIADSQFNSLADHSDKRRKANGKKERNRVYSKPYQL